MVTETTNLGLVKPDETDFYDIGVQNGNMDKIDAAITTINSKVANQDQTLNVSKSLPDTNGIYTVVEWKRTDNTLAKKSVLSNADTNGNYLKQTITFYGVDGTTVTKTQVWGLTYDKNGNVSSETLQSEVLADAAVG